LDASSSKTSRFIEARKHNWETLRRGLVNLEEFFDFSLPTHASAWNAPSSVLNSLSSDLHGTCLLAGRIRLGSVYASRQAHRSIHAP